MTKVMHNFARSHIYIYIYIGIAIFLASLISLSLIFNSNINSAHAANSADIEASVNIKPSLTLNIPTNNITMTLDPSTHAFDEKDLTVSVGTNNRYGYKLLVNTTNNATDLVNVADSSKTIPNLSDSSSFPANNWGYRLSRNASSSSGDYGAFTPGSVVNFSDSPVNNSIATMGFGAKIDYTKESGLYELNLSFKAIPNVTQTYMQNLDTNFCIDEPTVVIDERDSQAYTIRRLPDGRCWMVENLRFTGDPDDPDGTMTLHAATSNVVSDTTLTYGELATGDTSADSVNDPKIHKVMNNSGISGMSPIDNDAAAQSNIPTVWYNYSAASAGTITGNSNIYEAQYDVCPAGWRMPSYNEAGGMTSYLSEFSPTSGGYYIGGKKIQTATGNFWTSTPGNATNRRYSIQFSNDAMSLAPNFGRDGGVYVRCILNEPVGTVTTLQQFGALSSTDKTTLKNSMATGKPYSLRDTRDNQMYTVAKLKDDNVWLANNLNLGATTLNGDLTTSNSNGVSVAKSTFESWKGASSTATSGAYAASDGIDSGSKTAYGMLYNFCATAAGKSSYCTSSVTSDLTTDICPLGWRLPIGGSNVGEFSNLYTQYPSVTQYRSSVASGGASFALAGYIDSAGEVKAQGTYGYYWSRTRYDNSSMWIMYLDKDTVHLGNYTARVTPRSIRCILRTS